MSYITYIPTKGEEVLEAAFEFFESDKDYKFVNSIKRAAFFEAVQKINNSYQIRKHPFFQAIEAANEYLSYYFDEYINIREKNNGELFPGVFGYKFDKHGRYYLLALFNDKGMKYFQENILPDPQQTAAERAMTPFELK